MAGSGPGVGEHFDVVVVGAGLSGIGAAVHDSKLRTTRDTKDLGWRVLFHIPAEVGFQITPNNRLSVYYEHLTNFGLDNDNAGLDNLGVRFSHRF